MDEGPEEDFSSDRDQWHIWLPLVLKADGQDFFHWSRAKQLCTIAENTLRAHYLKTATITPPEEAQLLAALSDLLEYWARHDGFAQPRGDWGQVQAQLRQVRPLVEDLLY